MKITKTKTGYTAVVGIGKDDSGKQRTRRFTAPSQEELLADISDYKSRRRVEIGSRAFTDAVERYINAREALRSPATIRSYKSIQRTIKKRSPAFCAMSVDRIRDRDVQSVIDSLQRDGYTPKTIRNWSGLINSVLIAEGAPPAGTILPAKKTTDHDIPTGAEIRMMLFLVHGTPLDCPFQLALLGLRRSEICGIHPDDLSPKNVLHVHRGRVMADGGALVTKDSPKTDASNRYVQLPDHLANMIRRDGIFYSRPESLTRAYARFLSRYQFPAYHLHDCRHFFASYCHSLGVPEADILAAGGWKTPNVMRSVYRHSMAKNKAGDALAALISGR